MMAHTKARHDEQIYDQIIDHWTKFLLPPTIQYLVNHCSLQSKSNVWLALVRLDKKGYIKIVKGKAIPTGMTIDIHIGFQRNEGI